MKNNFVALLMSGDTEEWFETEDEAWAYVYSRSCDSCKNSDFDMCSAEWSVFSKEVWEDDEEL
jgi:hypothetical protein